jgi:hypothetical protein
VHTYFQQRIDEMDQGDHVPGGAATAAYGLWALSLDPHPADMATTSIVNYLLQIRGVQRLDRTKPANSQPRDGRWIVSCKCAPLQGSEIGDTVFVLIGQALFVQKTRIKHGNRLGLVIDKPILDMLQISADTPLRISTNGDQLLVTPCRGKS